MKRFKGSHSGIGIRRNHRVVALAVEHHPNGRAYRRVVLDNKDPHHNGMTVPSNTTSLDALFKMVPQIWTIGKDGDHPGDFPALSIARNIAYCRGNTLFKTAHLAAINLPT